MVSEYRDEDIKEIGFREFKEYEEYIEESSDDVDIDEERKKITSLDLNKWVERRLMNSPLLKSIYDKLSVIFKDLEDVLDMTFDELQLLSESMTSYYIMDEDLVVVELDLDKVIFTRKTISLGIKTLKLFADYFLAPEKHGVKLVSCNDLSKLLASMKKVSLEEVEEYFSLYSSRINLFVDVLKEKLGIEYEIYFNRAMMRSEIWFKLTPYTGIIIYQEQ